jgi:hypothetical protein
MVAALLAGGRWLKKIREENQPPYLDLEGHISEEVCEAAAAALKQIDLNATSRAGR